MSIRGVGFPNSPSCRPGRSEATIRGPERQAQAFRVGPFDRLRAGSGPRLSLRSAGVAMLDFRQNPGTHHDPDRRPDRRVGNRHRAGGPRPGDVGRQAVLRRGDGFRRRTEHAGLAGRRRLSRHAAGHQPALRRAGGAHRPRPQREDQPAQRVRPQELFLSRPAGRLPDQPVQGPDRRRGRSHRGPGRRHEPHGANRAAAPRAGRRQIGPRLGPEAHLRRPKPGRRRAHGDRLEAGPALGRRGRRLSRQAALDPALSRHLRRQHGAGLAARRRQRLGAPAG